VLVWAAIMAIGAGLLIAGTGGAQSNGRFAYSLKLSG